MTGQWRRTLKVLFWLVFVPFGPYWIGRLIDPYFKIGREGEATPQILLYLGGGLISLVIVVAGAIIYALTMCITHYIRDGRWEINP